MPKLQSYLGYNFCGPIGGHVIPQRVQNLYIREYARSKEVTVSFTVSEYFDSSRGLMLFSQFDHAAEIAGLVFYSFLQLPVDPTLRGEFLRRAFEAKWTLYFALEDLKSHDAESFRTLQRLHQISSDPRFEEAHVALLAQYR